MRSPSFDHLADLARSIFLEFSTFTHHPHKLWGLGLVSLRYRDFETDKILKRRGCLPAILALHVTAFTSLCLRNWLAV